MFIKITDINGTDLVRIAHIDGVSYVPKDNKLRLLTDKGHGTTYEYIFANHLEAENTFNEICKTLNLYEHTIIPV